MTDKTTDFQKLAEEAAKEAYDLRAMKCRPWSHEWTMWKPNFNGSSFQRRRCVRCGKTRERIIGF